MKPFIILILLFAFSTAELIPDNTCITEACVETAAMIATSIDHTIDPCDDFYQYACGNWQKDHPSPNDNNGWSHWIKLNNDMREKLLNLLAISSIEKDPNYLRPLINYFKGCADTNRRVSNQAQNFALIKKIINKFGGWPLIDNEWNETNYSIEKALIEVNKFMNSKQFLEIEVAEELRNNSQHIIAISNPFSNRQGYSGVYTYFFENENRITEEYYDGVKTNVQIVVETIKGAEINATVWDEEVKPAQALDLAVKKVATNINNSYIVSHYDSLRFTVKDLKKFEDIDLRFILDDLFKAENLTINDNDTILITDINYVKSIGGILQNATKRTVANYIALNMAMILAKFTTPLLDQLVTNVNVALIPTQCLSFGEELLPDLAGRLYMDKLFAKQSLADMKSFISSLREAFHIVLTENQWMDETSKANAITKLTAITEHIAFPEYSSNDTELLQSHAQYMNLSADNFLETMVTIFGIQRRNALRKLAGYTLPKSHWPPLSGVVVNAFYNPQLNAIFFPAGIAQFPFYQHERTLTTNLGGIGSVIGHEFTHGFDSFGSLFDKNGNLANLFTNISRQNFNERTSCFVKQYNEFHYATGSPTTPLLNLSGSKTINENIADNGGIKVSFKAFELFKEKNSDKIPKMPGDLSTFTEEQIFFLSYANLWCTNKNINAINYQIQNDVHSVANARVIGPLANFDQFGQSFNCPLGSKMNPTNKCLLW